ncbi:MAG: VanZ family protein [Pseudomonadota bacterium]
MIRPEVLDKKGFSHILTLHNGDDESQLMMGQWLSSIVFMNGNDYENKKQGKKIWANTADADSNEIFVTVTSGIGGTSLYLNGQLVKKQKDMILKVPKGDSKSRLIIGNSIYGKHSWEGRIRGLAFYRNVFPDHRAALHYSEWVKDGNFRFAEKEKPWILYTFDEKTGGRHEAGSMRRGGQWKRQGIALDHGTGRNNLTIPERMTVFKKALLQTSIEKLKPYSSFIGDFIINLLGFMPFGFIFSALVFRLRGKFPIYFILIAVGAGFLLSLSIEILQAWLPSRCSDAFDLILNTTGALFGSVIFVREKTRYLDRINRMDRMLPGGGEA